MNNEKKKSAIYIRVSTEDQAREGFSLGAIKVSTMYFTKHYKYEQFSIKIVKYLRSFIPFFTLLGT